MSKHFELTISGNKHLHGDSAAIELRFAGCEGCLQEAITLLFLNDAHFKKVINDAGKEANRRKKESDNGINPQSN